MTFTVVMRRNNNCVADYEGCNGSRLLKTNSEGEKLR